MTEPNNKFSEMINILQSKHFSKILESVKNPKIVKWCNCYRNDKFIKVQCFDTIEEANSRYIYEYNNKGIEIESRLIKICKFMPLFMRERKIQREFEKKVIFDN